MLIVIIVLVLCYKLAINSFFVNMGHMKITNLLTIVRLLLIPFIIALLYSSSTSFLILALALFLIASFTDWLDGYIARNYNLITTFGTFIDPIADKILILGIFFAFSDLNLVPLWMVLLVLFRELLVSGVRQVSSMKGKIIGANWMGKTKASLQILFILLAQIYLILKSINYPLAYWPKFLYLFFLGITLLALLFAFVFVYWNRDLLLKDF